ncbi:hypothetical protein ABVT39_013360 [Epinephelus coioides]
MHLRSSTSSHLLQHKGTTPGLSNPRSLTLLSTRRLVHDHIAAGSSPDTRELSASMVPYQEVHSTSQTQSGRAVQDVSQVAMRRPPGSSDLSGWRRRMLLLVLLVLLVLVVQLRPACDSPHTHFMIHT